LDTIFPSLGLDQLSHKPTPAEEEEEEKAEPIANKQIIY
jgi:hypothetical protein